MEEKSNKRTFVILAVIIAFQIMVTALIFAFVKGGSHSDEVWSYGLANSYYQPFVYQRAGVGIDEAAESDYINLREWVPGSVFHNYITVQEGQRFAYGSVWSNQTYDHHPPLYYLLLHTVCSLFPDSFSFGYGFILNCIFLAVTQIFLFKAAGLILGDSRAALTVCVLYGGARAALYTFTFIRQYSLLTMLTVMLLYFTAKLYSRRELKTSLPPILALSFAMFMTHYFGIVIAGLLTGCICLWMLFTKQIWRMLIYGFSQVAVLGLYFAVWPSALRHITEYTPFREKPLDMPAAVSELAGEMSAAQTGAGGIAAAVIAGLVVIALAVSLWKFKGSPAEGTDGPNFMPLFIVITSLGLVLAAAYKTELEVMGEAGLRYVFCLFPGLCILLIWAVTKAARLIPKLGAHPLRAAGAVAAAAVICSNIFASDELLYKNDPRDIDAAALTEGKVCAAVLPDDSEWMLTCLSDIFIGADSVFVTEETSFSEDLPAIEGRSIDFILIPESIAEGDTALEALCAGRSRPAEGTLPVMNTKAILYRLN